jgi:hypothetical protein
MLSREMIAVYYENHMKLINTTYGQNVEFRNVEAGGTQSNHWASKG